ncbi:MAG: hypothetical protein ACOC4M_11795 [Promethearchaeia archaeon]
MGISEVISFTKLKLNSTEKESTIQSPDKNEMNQIVTSQWPDNWVELDRKPANGMLVLSLAHISPYPKYYAIAIISEDGNKWIKSSQSTILGLKET